MTKTDVFLSVFGGVVWTVENAAKTLVWTKNFLSVFKKQKTEVFENALVWTGPYTKYSHQPTAQTIEMQHFFIRYWGWKELLFLFDFVNLL